MLFRFQSRGMRLLFGTRFSGSASDVQWQRRTLFRIKAFDKWDLFLLSTSVGPE